MRPQQNSRAESPRDAKGVGVRRSAAATNLSWIALVDLAEPPPESSPAQGTYMHRRGMIAAQGCDGPKRPNGDFLEHLEITEHL